MKIAIVADIPNWAIGHLAQSVEKNNERHEIKLMYVHPRDAGNPEIQEKFIKEIREFKPQLIDFEYFRTAGQLIEAFPELRRYKLLIVHHNMRTKAVYMWDWQNNPAVDKPKLNVDRVLVHCNKTREMISDAGLAKDIDLIRYGIDVNSWNYTDKEPEDIAIGYAGRIVPWKGLRGISNVAKKLGYFVQIMGRVEKADYWATVDKDNLRYDFMECSDDDRKDFYNNVTIFVQNAIDGYESGPLPLLEAMASGTPVITTPAGQAGYEEGVLQDRHNCLMIPFDDEEALEAAVNELMNDKELRNTLRKNAWNTVKNMTEEKMALEYSKLWNRIIYPDNKLVSVIIPATYDRTDQVKEIVKALTMQSYVNMEVVIAWDEEKNSDRHIFDADKYEITIKEVWTDKDKEKYPYNLAEARNRAVIEAEGDILIFNDSRLKPDENMVMMFVEAVNNAGAVTIGGNNKVWFFGNKGGRKDSFVENFSAVRRDFLIHFGMFCERMDKYGGMTQEIRSRWKKQKGEFYYLESAVAEEIKSSSNSSQKKKDISDSKFKLHRMYGDERL